MLFRPAKAGRYSASCVATPASAGRNGDTSHVADRDGLAKRGQRVACRFEFVREISREAGVGDGQADGAPVDLLRIVQLVTPWDAPGMVVADQIAVGANRPDDVALH